MRDASFEALFLSMRKVRPAFRKLFSMASDLTDLEIVILGVMVESEMEDVSIKTLFDDLSPIRPAKLTQVTNRLETLGLIRKERDRRDRRRIRLIITDKGRREYEGLQEKMKSMLYGAIKDLAAQEIEVLIQSLNIWQKALKNL